MMGDRSREPLGGGGAWSALLCVGNIRGVNQDGCGDSLTSVQTPGLAPPPPEHSRFSFSTSLGLAANALGELAIDKVLESSKFWSQEIQTGDASRMS
jgi:hypothetical protein